MTDYWKPCERPSSYVRFGSGTAIAEPNPIGTFPRLAVEAAYTPGGSILVKYAFSGGTYSHDDCPVKTGTANYVTVGKGTGYSYLDVRFLIKRTGNTTAMLYTPCGLAPGTTLPAGWASPQSVPNYAYNPASPPSMVSYAVRGLCDTVFVEEGGQQKLLVTIGNRTGDGSTDVHSAIDPNLGIEFDEDTLTVVYRIYRTTTPRVSCSIITPGGNPGAP